MFGVWSGIEYLCLEFGLVILIKNAENQTEDEVQRILLTERYEEDSKKQTS